MTTIYDANGRTLKWGSGRECGVYTRDARSRPLTYEDHTGYWLDRKSVV